MRIEDSTFITDCCSAEVSIITNEAFSPTTVPLVHFRVAIACGNCNAVHRVGDKHSCMVRLSGNSRSPVMWQLTSTNPDWQGSNSFGVMAYPAGAFWLERALRYNRLNCADCGAWCRISAKEEERIREFFSRTLTREAIETRLLEAAEMKIPAGIL